MVRYRFGLFWLSVVLASWLWCNFLHNFEWSSHAWVKLALCLPCNKSKFSNFSVIFKWGVALLCFTALFEQIQHVRHLILIEWVWIWSDGNIVFKWNEIRFSISIELTQCVSKWIQYLSLHSVDYIFYVEVWFIFKAPGNTRSQPYPKCTSTIHSTFDFFHNENIVLTQDVLHWYCGWKNIHFLWVHNCLQIMNFWSNVLRQEVMWYQRAAKVLLTTSKIQTDSAFQAKALHWEN
jgi:hypothetical protein